MLLAVVACVVATTVAGAFATSLVRQWLARRRDHALAWAISLYAFSGGTLAVGLGVALGWSSATFGTYWLLGALLTVPFLAVGQLHLMAPQGGAMWWTVAGLFVAWAFFTMLQSPVDAEVLARANTEGGIPVGSEAYGEGALAYGLLAFASRLAVVPILGSIWSGVRTRRWGVLLIGVGAAVAGGSFGVVRAVDGDAQAVATSLLFAVGVALMYYGFVAAGRPSRRASFTEKRP